MTRKLLSLYDPFLSEADNKARNYNYSTNAGNQSRPHSLVINYNWELPLASKKWDNVVHAASRSTAGRSPASRSCRTSRATASRYAFTGAPTNDLSGNGYARRVTLTCDPNLPRGERTFDRQFRTECISPGGGPSDPYYLGTSTNDEYNPRATSTTTSRSSRTSRFGQRNLQFRAELYNAFNTTQYQDVDTSAVFNYATGAADRHELRPRHRRSAQLEPRHPAGDQVPLLSHG